MDFADRLNQHLKRLHLAEIACHEPHRLSIRYGRCTHAVTRLPLGEDHVEIFARFTSEAGVRAAELCLDGEPAQWLPSIPEIEPGHFLKLGVVIILPGVSVPS